MDVARMIRAAPLQPLADADMLADAIHAASACAEAASLCADACLGEPAVEKMRLCIRLNLDAADLCHTLVRLLSRQVDPDLKVICTLLDACALAVESCADECERHAHHDHCRLCMDACRRAHEAFVDLRNAIPDAPDEPPAPAPPSDGAAH